MENLITLRKKSKLTQKDVAEYLGISRQAYANYEVGNREPDIGTLKKLSEYFGVTIDTLLDNEMASDIKPNAIVLDQNDVYMIPVFESVSAGFGAIPQDAITEYTPLYISSPGEAAETICIKVKGDSMYPKIEDGDIIAVHKQDSVDSGTIAVILLDGEEGLVKRVEYGSDWIELHSINPMYKTMRFDGADVLRIRVLGAVRKIIKSV